MTFVCSCFCGMDPCSVERIVCSDVHLKSSWLRLLTRLALPNHVPLPPPNASMTPLSPGHSSIRALLPLDHVHSLSHS